MRLGLRQGGLLLLCSFEFAAAGGVGGDNPPRYSELSENPPRYEEVIDRPSTAVPRQTAADSTRANRDEIGRITMGESSAQTSGPQYRSTGEGSPVGMLCGCALYILSLCGLFVMHALGVDRDVVDAYIHVMVRFLAN